MKTKPRDSSTAYRGFYIDVSPFDQKWRVSKDGYHICEQDSLELAKSAIDELLG